LFYSPEEMKVFVTTNARFHEEDYVNYSKPKSKVVLDEMLYARNTTFLEVLEDEVVVLDTPLITIDVTPRNIILRHRGKIVWASNRFIREAHVLISDEIESNPSTYKEAVNDVDADHLVKAIKCELLTQNL
jgi:hypothetical protein